MNSYLRQLAATLAVLAFSASANGALVSLDFETGFSTEQGISELQIGDIDLGVSCGTATNQKDCRTFQFGDKRKTAFGSDKVQKGFESRVGTFGLSDDSKKKGADFFFTFSEGVMGFGLDLIDYRKYNKKESKNGVATLQLFSDASFESELVSDQFASVKGLKSGNLQTLFASVGEGVVERVLSASLTFSRADGGIGLDNLTIDTAPTSSLLSNNSGGAPELYSNTADLFAGSDELFESNADEVPAPAGVALLALALMLVGARRRLARA